jgi:RNA polymerase sigma factor (sigma-70 family)
MTSDVPEFLADARSVEQLRERLLDLAHARYRVSRVDAEDVVQTTFTAYLQVHHRYPFVADQGAILYGIFRKKCAEYIDRSVREQRRLSRYCRTPDAARENPWIRPEAPAQTPAVLDDLLRREARTRILEAIAELRPASRELVTLILTRELRRKELIGRLRINKNTFDSRLHACRAELRTILRRKGVGEWRSRLCSSRRGGRVRPLTKRAPAAALAAVAAAPAPAQSLLAIGP